VLRVVTDLGATVVVLGIGALVALVERRRFRDHNTPFRNVALYLLLVIAGQWIVTQLIKLGVGRTRPVLGVAAGLDGSFPSGHSAAAAATFAACALVLGMARSHRAQMALTGAAVAIAAAVASCRVLLGLHWFSDVVGGLALGWAWFAVVSLAFGGRLLRFGAPVELAERHDALRQLEIDGAGGSDAGAGEQVRPAAGRRPPG
jgi:undecaprenyl-diphosphatase